MDHVLAGASPAPGALSLTPVAQQQSASPTRWRRRCDSSRGYSSWPVSSTEEQLVHIEQTRVRLPHWPSRPCGSRAERLPGTEEGQVRLLAWASTDRRRRARAFPHEEAPEGATPSAGKPWIVNWRSRPASSRKRRGPARGWGASPRRSVRASRLSRAVAKPSIALVWGTRGRGCESHQLDLPSGCSSRVERCVRDAEAAGATPVTPIDLLLFAVQLSRVSTASGTQGLSVQVRPRRSFLASSKAERPPVKRMDPGASPGRGVLDDEPDECAGPPC